MASALLGEAHLSSSWGPYAECPVALGGTCSFHLDALLAFLWSCLLAQNLLRAHCSESQLSSQTRLWWRRTASGRF